MKKIALFVCVAFAISMTSCKKEVACECTITIFGVTSTTTSAYAKLNKKDRDAQKEACEKGTVAGLSTCKQVTK